MADQSAYQRICAAACEWCAKGQSCVGITANGPWVHMQQKSETWLGGGSVTSLPSQPCTAPTKDTVIDLLATKLEQANTLIRLTYEEYEKAIVDNPALSGLGPYDGNPLKAWHGLYGWLMDSAKQMAMKLETISKYASRTAGELERVRKEAAKLGHEPGCASLQEERMWSEDRQEYIWANSGDGCDCAQSRIQVKP